MSSEDVSTERFTQKPRPAAFGEKRREQVPVAFPRHRLVDEADAVRVEELAVGIVGIDHHHAAFVEVEMTQDERQRSPPDRAEADHHDRAVDRQRGWANPA